MNKTTLTTIGTILVLTLTTTAQAEQNSIRDIALKSGLSAIPDSSIKSNKLAFQDKEPNLKEIELGKKLYFDTRLSKSGLISCNTCHNLAMGGDDGVSIAIGDRWTKNPHDLNSPTVLNAVFNKKQFWDGRSPDLEDQATGPIQATPEMAATPEHVQNVIMSIPEYLNEFRDLNNDKNYKPTIKDVGKAIGAYERTLITPSRYDKFLNGDSTSLTFKEQMGLRTFIDKGCVSCHSGINLGGDMSNFPLIGEYKYASGDFKGDKNGMIKVPTLRNIDQTAPYFHNGAVWNLREAIEIMAETQLGTKLSKRETSNIEAFLKSTNGNLKVELPILPVSTNKTEKPIY